MDKVLENFDLLSIVGAFALGGGMFYFVGRFAAAADKAKPEPEPVVARETLPPKPKVKKSKKKSKAKKPSSNAKSSSQKKKADTAKPSTPAKSKKVTEKQEKSKPVAPIVKNNQDKQVVAAPEVVKEDQIYIDSTTEDGWETVKTKKSKPKKKINTMLDSLPQDSEGNVTITIPIAANKIGAVKGRGGVTVNVIQSSSGARINLAAESCSVTGSVSEVAKAKSMILKIVENMNTITLDEKEVGIVIGPKGANISRIEAESGAKLDLNNTDCTISGSPPSIQKAKELIKLYIENRGPPAEDSQVLALKKSEGYIVIGKKGSTIRSLQDETGARIDVTVAGRNESVDTVTVSGNKDEVVKAIAAIKREIARNTYTEKLQLDGSLFSLIIGTGGETVKAVQNESGANVNIGRAVDGSVTVSIVGTTEDVKAARQLIEKKVLGPPELEPGEIVFECKMGGATGKIIGTKGANVQRYEKQAKIKQVGTTMYVYGIPEKVKPIQEEISTILEKHKELEAQTEETHAAAAAVAADSSGSLDWGSTSGTDDQDIWTIPTNW